MKNLLAAVNEIVNSFGNRVYMVGGWLRDQLLGRLPGDIDLLVEVLAEPILNWRLIAHRLNSKLVILDEGRGLYRLIASTLDGKIQVDIDMVTEGTLTENLKRRDFSINALAIPLVTYLRGEINEQDVIDPVGGLADLRTGVVRVCSSDAIVDDPLRSLRAFRLAAKLGFNIEPCTLEIIRHYSCLVTGCAGERVWDELSAILELEAAPVIRQLDKEVGLLEHLLPEIKPLKGLAQGGHHVDDAWEHSLKTLEQFELFLPCEKIVDGSLSSIMQNEIHSKNNQETVNEINAGKTGLLSNKISAYFNGYITRSRNRLPVFKLACLLHDVGKQFTLRYAGQGKYTFYGHHQAGVPMARAVADRLKMSGREKNVLAALVGGHMDPLFLYQMAPLGPVALRRFYQRAAQEATGLLLLSLADFRSSRLTAGYEEEARAYTAFIQDLLQKYYNEQDVMFHPHRLLDGHEVCILLGIKPSPLVRQVLESLIDAQVEGKVKTKTDAEAFVRHFEGAVWGKK